MTRKVVIGVMGPGDTATQEDCQTAFELGRQIALQGWVLLTGGRNAGVMDAASRGAAQEHGLTIGILPTDTEQGMSAAIAIPILTGMGNARNVINILSSHIIIACGMGSGTASEVAFALKTNKPVILLNADDTSYRFFKGLATGSLCVAETPAAAIHQSRQFLQTCGF